MRWEYLILDLTDLARREKEIDVLNSAGADGWELVAVLAPLRAFLKRPLTTPRKPVRTGTK